MPASTLQRESLEVVETKDNLLTGSEDILAQIDALRFSTARAKLPSKKDLFQRVRESFISQPERWQRERINWISYKNQFGSWHMADHDGWVMNMPNKIGKRTLGFYRTGLFWIRIGEVERRENGLFRINTEVWVYIFCPRFRRTIRKYRNWRLLRDLEKQDG
jgi:hypothetical protein